MKVIRVRFLLNRFLGALGLITKKRAYYIFSKYHIEYRKAIGMAIERDFGRKYKPMTGLDYANLEQNFNGMFNVYSDVFNIEPFELG